MGLKRTTVYLDEHILFLASFHGITNLSDFFRKCLESVVLTEDEIDQPDLIRIKAKRIAAAMKHEMKAQKKIVTDQEAAMTEAVEYREQRREAVEAACLKQFLKHHDFSRYLPENDLDFIHLERFEQAVSEVSSLSGYDVDPREVIAIYHQKAGTRAVGSRETGESVYGIRSGLS